MDIDVDGREKGKRGTTTVIITGRKPGSATFYRLIDRSGRKKSLTWMDGWHTVRKYRGVSSTALLLGGEGRGKLDEETSQRLSLH
jgi:hypothetical protein